MRASPLRHSLAKSYLAAGGQFARQVPPKCFDQRKTHLGETPDVGLLLVGQGQKLGALLVAECGEHVVGNTRQE